MLTLSLRLQQLSFQSSFSGLGGSRNPSSTNVQLGEAFLKLFQSFVLCTILLFNSLQLLVNIDYGNGTIRRWQLWPYLVIYNYGQVLSTAEPMGGAIYVIATLELRNFFFHPLRNMAGPSELLASHNAKDCLHNWGIHEFRIRCTTLQSLLDKINNVLTSVAQLGLPPTFARNLRR